MNFPWIFNPPATYWDGLSMIFSTSASKEGGLDKLKGKTIGYIFFDGGYGREPIPLLEQFAKDYGFTVKQYPVPAAEMQNQSALWLNVRRDRPDWMIMWGWGAMNPTAVKEAAKINYPDGQVRRHLVVGRRGRRASGGGAEPRAISSLNFNGVGTQLSRRSRTSRSTSSTRARARSRSRQVRREPLQPRRLQLGADRRSDPQCAEDHRQEGGDRRGRAARLRDAARSRRRAGRSSACRTSARRSPTCPAPTTTAITRPICSNGTAPSG